MVRKLFYNFALPLLLLVAQGSSAQSGPANDSLLFYLRNIRSAKDSGMLSSVSLKINTAAEQVLIKPEVWTEIRNLQKVLPDREYNNLSLAYLSGLLALNTTASLERALEIGSGLVDNILQAKSAYQYYSALWMFRELRIAYRGLGKLNESLKYYSEAEKVFLKKNDSAGVSIANNVMSGSYFRLGMQERAIYHQGKSIAYLNQKPMDMSIHPSMVIYGISGKLNRFAVLGSYFLSDKKLKEADSCLNEAMNYYHKLDSPLLHPDVPYMFLQKAVSKSLAGDTASQQAFDTCYRFMQLYKSPPSAMAVYYQARAADLIRLGQAEEASIYLQKTHQLIDSFKLGIINSWGEILPEYYEARIAMGKPDYGEAVRLLQVQIEKLELFNLRTTKIMVLELLAEAYDAKGNTRDAYLAMRQAFSLRNSVIHDEKEARTLSFETERRIQENETAIMLLNARDEANKRTRFYLFGIIALLGLLAVALAFFYRNKQKTGRELQSKNGKLEQALNQLKATQSQLVQSEKMASLGELTAGIAHEIQNPLNFVNNFSEVSKELIEELSEEVERGNYNEVRAIAKDLVLNLDKINHHGKRADAIVRGMLQHSRSSTGQKEPTDLNALCEEYLRLAYHGWKGKDSSFSAGFKTEFDPNAGVINLVPQDIGRVLLNLVNNAFYAVHEKAKQHPEGYEPRVMVATKRRNNSLEVIVSDNGPGIPDAIKDKIFQPFFTTKPTGQGTGLGLSLSYDIVRAHGGDLILEKGPAFNEKSAGAQSDGSGAAINEGTLFRLVLPV